MITPEKLNRVLVKLEKLLLDWGLNSSDWILVSQYAYRLLGYDVSVREGHFNIRVNKNKLPWKPGKVLETHPPMGTRYLSQLNTFIQETHFEFDLVPDTPRKFEKRLIDSVRVNINNSLINVQSAVGALAELDELLGKCNQEGWGSEKGLRVLQSVENQMQAIANKGEKETANKYRQLIKKYSYLKIPPQIIRKQYLIRGVSASPGKVKGTVRIVLKPSSTVKLIKGEILVTTMVSPKFTNLIKNATAIITDEGGMLCHAAIIAREMNIPCLVGTKNATKLLKDNDLVELDTDKGIVRNFNKNS